MPKVISVATAIPSYQFSQSRIKDRYTRLLEASGSDLSAASVLDHSGVENRFLAFPLDYYLAGHSFERRNQDYIDQALVLSEQAIRDCLNQVGVALEEVGHIVSVTTTGLATPSLEAILVQRLCLSPKIRRTPVFGIGCAGGVVGLARSMELLKAGPDQLALLLSVELCSQTFVPTDISKLGAVAVSLFGDGAAAVLVSGDDWPTSGPRCVGMQSILFSDSLDIMGWKFTGERMQLVLSRKLLVLVKKEMPSVINEFLSGFGLRVDDVRFWIAHPGSAAVLDTLENALGLPTGKLRWSRDFLRQYGNLSSASVLFILKEVIEQGKPQPEDYGLVVAMGPGFSAELVLLKW